MNIVIEHFLFTMPPVDTFECLGKNLEMLTQRKLNTDIFTALIKCTTDNADINNTVFILMSKFLSVKIKLLENPQTLYNSLHGPI